MKEQLLIVPGTWTDAKLAEFRSYIPGVRVVREGQLLDEGVREMVVNRDRMEARLEKWSNGSMVVAVAVALVVGLAVGALFF